MKNLKNVLIVGAAVLLTAGAVGGVAYLTKGFTTADPISDLTKQGEVVQVLEKTVDPLTHLATYAIPTADVEAVSGGNIAVPFYLDDEDEFLSYDPAGTIDDVGDLSLFSASQTAKIEDQLNGAGELNVGILFSNGYNIHEWASTSEADTKIKAFDTLRFNISIPEMVMLVSSGKIAEEAADTPVKSFAKVETITALHTYIDIDMSEVGTDGYMSGIVYSLVGLEGNAIPDIEIKSVELVNKACAYDFVSYQPVPAVAA